MSEYNGRNGNGYQPLSRSAPPPPPPPMRTFKHGHDGPVGVLVYTAFVFAVAFGLGIIAVTGNA